MKSSEVLRALSEEKIFEVLTKEQLDKKINALKIPGDFFIYKESDENFKLFYHKELQPDGSSFAAQHTICSKLISIKDFNAYMEGDKEKLLQYIKQGLKIIIGWDFDKTLTYHHTWYGNVPVSKELNRNSPEDTDKVMSALCEKKEIVQIIISNNYKQEILEHISLWFGNSNFIQKIWDRRDFHGTGSDKEICFRWQHDSILEKRIVDENNFLKLNSVDPVVDVVSCYLVDDDYDTCKDMRKFGIKFFWANLENNAHLNQIDKEFNLGADIVLKKGLKPPMQPQAKLQQGEKSPLLSSGSAQSNQRQPSEKSDTVNESCCTII